MLTDTKQMVQADELVPTARALLRNAAAIRERAGGEQGAARSESAPQPAQPAEPESGPERRPAAVGFRDRGVSGWGRQASTAGLMDGTPRAFDGLAQSPRQQDGYVAVDDARRTD